MPHTSKPYQKWGISRYLIVLLSLLTSTSLLANLPQGQAALSGDLSLHKYYWLSPQSDLTVQEIKNQTFKSFEHLVSLSYEKSDLWIKIGIPASEKTLHLYIQPFWLDELELNDPEIGLTPIRLGDRYLTTKLSVGRQDHVLPVAAHPTERNIYLRVRSSSTYLVYPQLLTEKDIIQAEKRKLLYSSLYIGILLSILLFASLAAVISRDKLISLFLTKHIVYLLYSIFTLGLGNILLDFSVESSVLDKAHAYSVFLVVSITTIFDGYLIGAYTSRKRLWKYYFIFASLFPILLSAAYILGHESTALYFNSIHVLPLCVMLFLGSIFIQRDSMNNIYVPHRYIISYYFISMLAVGLGVLLLLGFFESDLWKMYIILAQGLFSALIMVAILIYRQRNISIQIHQSQTELAIARQINEVEASKNKEQSHLLNMLMHEIKTPLSTILYAIQGTSRSYAGPLELALQACHEINRVLQRCIDLDWLKHSPRVQHKQVRPLKLLDALIFNLPNPSRILVDGDWDGWLETDEHYLRIILSNLLNNALSYSPSDSAVRIQVDCMEQDSAQRIRIAILNRPGAAGWPDPERIFSKYYRSDGANALKGTGLGLAVCEKLARDLGGHLIYRPTHQEVVFELWIPQSASSTLS